MKRFQECNWLVKLYRYRWYMCIPFIYIYETIKYKNTISSNHRWGILIGEMQIKMNWTWTNEEVMKHFKDFTKKHKTEDRKKKLKSL